MVKILCIGTFLVGLLGTCISYTIDYFNIDIDEAKNEIQKK